MNEPILFNPFGTELLKHKINDEFFQLLKDKVEEIRPLLKDETYVIQNSHAQYLAGKNSYQIRMDYDYIKYIGLEDYLLTLGNFYILSNNSRMKIQLGNVWINYINAGDSNPLHTHDALLSGVIYIKQDDSIYDEMMTYSTNNMHGAPGVTHFVHKLEMNHFSKNIYANITNPGELIMFPSWLTHYVNAHHSEGERITIAFNILEA